MSTHALSMAARAAASTARRHVRDALARTVQTFAALQRRRRELAVTRRDLERLDDATLRDLGLHRSEVGSLAAELHGIVVASRQLSMASRFDARM